MPSRFTRDNSALVLHEFPRPSLSSNRDMDNEARKLFLKIAQVIDLIIYYFFYFCK